MMNKKRILSLLLSVVMLVSTLTGVAFASEEPSVQTADEKLAYVQTLIDELPTVEDVTADDYDAVSAAYDEYDALTDEEKALITGAEAFSALFAWFNAQTEPVADAVSYIDENGNAKSVTDYTVVTSSDEDVSWGAGWYVVKGKVTMEGSVSVVDGVNLILTDGSELVANKGIGSLTGNLAIYGQTEGTGKLKASGGIYQELYKYGIVVSNLTVNGGVIEAESGATFNEEQPEEIPISCVGIVVGYTFTVNGGSVTADGGDIHAVFKDNKNSNSVGIDAETLIINDGTVKAIGGDAYDETSTNNHSSGVWIAYIKVNGGTLITDYDTTHTGGYYDIYSWSLEVSGGTIKSARTEESVKVYAIESVKVSGGTVKFGKSGMGEISVSGSVTLSSVLAEGEAFYHNGAKVNLTNITKIGSFSEDMSMEDRVFVLAADGSEGTGVTGEGSNPGEGSEPDPAEDAYAEVTVVGENGDHKIEYAESEDDVLDYLESGYVAKVKLLDDVYADLPSESVIIVKSNRIVLDLNGKTLSFGDCAFVAQGILTIEDSTKKQEGLLEASVITSAGYATLTITSGNFAADSFIIYGSAVISGGYIKINSDGQEPMINIAELSEARGSSSLDGIKVLGTGSLRISGGVIEGNIENEHGLLEISGGTIGSDDDYAYDGFILCGEGSVVRISGGKINAFAARRESYVWISGGEFGIIEGSDTYPFNMLKAGYAFYDSANNKPVYAYGKDVLQKVKVRAHTCKFDEEGYCACGRMDIGDNGNEKEAIAKIVSLDNAGDEYVYYTSDASDICAAMGNPAIDPVITLLDDVQIPLSSINVLGNAVLDLNGHEFVVAYENDEESSEESEITYGTVVVGTASSLVVKDSSNGKKGIFKAKNFVVSNMGSLRVESGNLVGMGEISEGEDSVNMIEGSFVLSGGTANFGKNAFAVMRYGKLTVSGGTLEAPIVYVTCRPSSSMVPQTLAETDEQVTLPKGQTEALYTGDSVLITGGEIKGAVMLEEATAIKMTGGKVSNNLALGTGSLVGGIYAYSGATVNIMGGEILYFTAQPQEGGMIKLTGGTFEALSYYSGDVEAFLGDNCAFYTQSKKNGSYDKLVSPLSYEDAYEEGVYELENVQVKAHTCSFDEDGNCLCGRTGKPNVKVVAYIDEDGETQNCTKYTLITKDTKTLTEGWYVADGNVKINGTLEVEKDVHLILTDGSTLTVTGRIEDIADDDDTCLNIYAQSSGKKAGKLNVSSGVDDFGRNDAIRVYKMVLNGGEVSATAAKADNVRNNVGIDAYYITVNDGTLNATSDDCVGSSYGIWVDDMLVNGGVVNAKSGNINAKSAEDNNNSCGISAEWIGVNDGEVNANGGKIDINSDTYDVAGYSMGLSSMVIEINGGVVKAEGGEVTADGIAAAKSYGTYAVYIELNGGMFTSNGGNIISKSAYSNDYVNESAGICSECNLTVNDGTLNVGCGDVTVYGGVSSYTNGIYAYNRYSDETAVEINGGVVNASVGNVIIKTKDVPGDMGYSALIEAADVVMDGGTINIKSGEGYDFYVFGQFGMLDGTIKSDRVGGAVRYEGRYLYVSDCDIILENSEIDCFDVNDTDLIYYLAEGYSYYVEGTELTDTDGVETLTSATIAKKPITVSLSEGDDEKGVTVDLSKALSDYSKDNVYHVDSYESGINVTDIENGKITVTANGAKADDECFIKCYAQNIGNGFISAFFIKVSVTDKLVPEVTLSKNVIEKTYDGYGLEIEEVEKIAKVTYNGKVVAGEWSWDKYAPTGVMNGTAKAVFVPTDNTYASVEVTVNVKINPLKLKGEPEYISFKEAGHTLGEACLEANEFWPDGTLRWTDENGNELSDDTEIEKNVSYNWTFEPDEANFEVIGGSIKLWKKTSSSTPNTAGSANKKDDDVTDKPEDKTEDKTEDKNEDKTDNKPEDKNEGTNTGNQDKNEGTSNKPASKKRFRDVHDAAHWAESYIDYVAELGLMNGVTEDEFAPDNSLTRAMLVAILYRAAGSPDVNKSIPFGDVSAEDYFASAVIWAQQNGIVSGMSEDMFAPDQPITREQIATIIYRYAIYMGYDVSVGADTNILSYTDAESISEYAVEAIAYAVGSGLMKGKTESTINPGDEATRAEIAAILQRFLVMNKSED